jgi:hypothetical protein
VSESPKRSRGHGGEASIKTSAAALAVLGDSISVDVHTHGGGSGITSTAPPSEGDAGGIAGGRLPCGRAGRFHPYQE